MPNEPQSEVKLREWCSEHQINFIPGEGHEEWHQPHTEDTTAKEEVKTFLDYQQRMEKTILVKDKKPTQLSDHVAVILMLNSHAQLIHDLKIEMMGIRGITLQLNQENADLKKELEEVKERMEKCESEISRLTSDPYDEY